MAKVWKEQIRLVRPGWHSLPGDLGFVGLVRPQGNEAVRIRFFREPAIVVDLPLSAETLVELVRALAPLSGKKAEEVITELKTLQQNGQLLKG